MSAILKIKSTWFRPRAMNHGYSGLAMTGYAKQQSQRNKTKTLLCKACPDTIWPHNILSYAPYKHSLMGFVLSCRKLKNDQLVYGKGELIHELWILKTDGNTFRFAFAFFRSIATFPSKGSTHKDNSHQQKPNNLHFPREHCTWMKQIQFIKIYSKVSRLRYSNIIKYYQIFKYLKIEINNIYIRSDNTAVGATQGSCWQFFNLSCGVFDESVQTIRRTIGT